MTGNQNTIARIRSQDNLTAGIEQFLALFPDMVPIVDALPEIPLRARKPGFEGMAEIITAQQVSKASATAIFDRTKAAIQPFDAATLLAMGDAPLVAAGQSRAKQATLTGLARAIVDHDLDLESLCDVPVEEAMRHLTALHGIGPWSAEVFLLFCAGHTDIFPAGDVALQHATAMVCSLADKPDTVTTRKLAESWSPLRGIAARILYAHYARIRGRSAV